MAYRILSLDGGGAWALIEVHALMALFGRETTGHTVLSEFDLVAANSGGSLVLGGLIEDLKLSELVAYFEDEQKRKAVFSPTRSWSNRILQGLLGIGPKYSAKAKLPAIQHLLPKTGPLPITVAASGIRRSGAQADLHVLIIGFDFDRNRAKFFRSAKTGAHAAGAGVGKPAWGQGENSAATLADAIHASTNAPVNYFDSPAAFPESTARYWDGGITGCNNPVLAAVTEAIVLGQTPTDVVALSLGTGTVSFPWPQPGDAPSPYLQKPSEQSTTTDLKKLATAILDDPPDIASFLAHVLTGSGAGLPASAQTRIVRMSPLVAPMRDPATNSWTAPGDMTCEAFIALSNLDMDATEQSQVDAIAAFAELWLQDRTLNQPVRMNSDTLELELGDDRFSHAATSWATIKDI